MVISHHKISYFIDHRILLIVEIRHRWWAFALQYRMEAFGMYVSVLFWNSPPRLLVISISNSKEREPPMECPQKTNLCPGADISMNFSSSCQRLRAMESMPSWTETKVFLLFLIGVGEAVQIVFNRPTLSTSSSLANQRRFEIKEKHAVTTRVLK